MSGGRSCLGQLNKDDSSLCLAWFVLNIYRLFLFWGNLIPSITTMLIHKTDKYILAATQSAYVASEHVGYINGDTWWLRPEDLYQSVVRYWKGLDQMFPLRDSDIRKLLAQNGLIEVEHSTRNGEERVSYTRKTTLEGRPRMLVLRVEAARKYLDSALDDE